MSHQLAQIDFKSLQNVASPNFSSGSTLADLLTNTGGPNLISLLFFGAGALAFLYLIYAGISFATSRGDPKATAAAQQKLTYAIAGLLVVFSSYWVVQFAQMFFGFSSFGI